MEIKKPLLPPELAEFIRLFNQEKFFEAHEVLESLWRKTPQAPKDFYQGLIQVAAALVHLQKGTPQGGQKLIQKAAQHLLAYPSPFLGMDWKKILAETEKSLSSLGPPPKIEAAIDIPKDRG